MRIDDLARRLFLLVALLCVLGGATDGAAQGITYEGCRDVRGQLVASVLNWQLPDVASATLGPGGQPIIFYNPNVLSRLSPQTRLFFYAHECGHHALGHAFGSNPMAREQEADCWGIRTLYTRGILGDRDIAAIQGDLHFSPGDWTHLPGPQRAINLRACLRGDGPGPGPGSSMPPPPRNGRCCDGFGTARCVITFPGPLGSPCLCPGLGYGVTCG